ncbi:MAG: MBL fold metallo-hydrolase [Actinomycetota bacterium]|nr:MBL fold metallo-hydrolase [Actinomycetota bacterium]
MTEPTIIDTKMHGRDGITGSFLVRDEKTALVETGPKSSVEHVFEGLRSAGIDHLDWIVVTHIHLDHAGAAGTLAREFSDATIAVHPVGAPHLIEPSKLWASAARIYKDEMEQLWGGIDPIPEERVHVLEDGDKIDLGGRSLQAIDTPGHAYHHHAYLDDSTGTLFCGDALGVRLPEVGIVRPATPPPEFHLEKAIESIRRIAQLRPESLWLTHFGPHDRGERTTGVEEFCDQAVESLRRWESWVRAAREQTSDLDEAAKIVQANATQALEQHLGEDSVDRMEQTTSYWMNTWGYMRYLDKVERSG